MPNWKTYESSVRLLSAIVAAHPNLKLNYDEIAGLMGSDTTVSALKSEILERTKAIGKHQVYMKAAGQDPAQIDISSFDSRKSRQAIAREYGEGVTDGTPAKTPTPRKRGPSKKKQQAMDVSMDDDEDTETQSAFDETPSKKKTPLNKVAAGRVTKASGGRSKPRPNYAESDHEDDEVDEDFTIVKSEPASNPFAPNGHSNGDGNGHAHTNGHDNNGYGNDYEENGYTASGAEETYFAASEEYV